MKIFFDQFQNLDKEQVRRRRRMDFRKKDPVELLDKQERKQQKKRGFWKLVPLWHTALIAALMFGLEIVYIQIFLNAHKLRWFFVPLVFVYFAAVSAVAYWFATRVDRLKERELMGDEWFFHQYPLERWLNRWSKWYSRWQIEQVKKMRERRQKHNVPLGGASAVAPENAWAMNLKGPEMEERGLFTKHRRTDETGRRALRRQKKAQEQLQHEAKLQEERKKYLQELREKRAKEAVKYGPDLPDSGFASWCETNADQSQIIH